jgi:hypothetical protein
MNCAVCGWESLLVKQWESNHYACALFRCEPCESDISVKTPIKNMRSWFKEEE